jgi:hypothetical protein
MLARRLDETEQTQVIRNDSELRAESVLTSSYEYDSPFPHYPTSERVVIWSGERVITGLKRVAATRGEVVGPANS